MASAKVTVSKGSFKYVNPKTGKLDVSSVKSQTTPTVSSQKTVSSGTSSGGGSAVSGVTSGVSSGIVTDAVRSSTPVQSMPSGTSSGIDFSSTMKGFAQPTPEQVLSPVSGFGAGLQSRITTSIQEKPPVAPALVAEQKRKLEAQSVRDVLRPGSTSGISQKLQLSGLSPSEQSQVRDAELTAQATAAARFEQKSAALTSEFEQKSRTRKEFVEGFLSSRQNDLPVGVSASVIEKFPVREGEKFTEEVATPLQRLGGGYGKLSKSFQEDYRAELSKPRRPVLEKNVFTPSEKPVGVVKSFLSSNPFDTKSLSGKRISEREYFEKQQSEAYDFVAFNDRLNAQYEKALVEQDKIFGQTNSGVASLKKIRETSIAFSEKIPGKGNVARYIRESAKIPAGLVDAPKFFGGIPAGATSQLYALGRKEARGSVIQTYKDIPSIEVKAYKEALFTPEGLAQTIPAVIIGARIKATENRISRAGTPDITKIKQTPGVNIDVYTGKKTINAKTFNTLDIKRPDLNIEEITGERFSEYKIELPEEKYVVSEVSAKDFKAYSIKELDTGATIIETSKFDKTILGRQREMITSTTLDVNGRGITEVYQKVGGGKLKKLSTQRVELKPQVGLLENVKAISKMEPINFELGKNNNPFPRPGVFDIEKESRQYSLVRLKENSPVVNGKFQTDITRNYKATVKNPGGTSLQEGLINRETMKLSRGELLSSQPNNVRLKFVKGKAPVGVDKSQLIRLKPEKVDGLIKYGNIEDNIAPIFKTQQETRLRGKGYATIEFGKKEISTANKRAQEVNKKISQAIGKEINTKKVREESAAELKSFRKELNYYNTRPASKQFIKGINNYAKGYNKTPVIKISNVNGVKKIRVGLKKMKPVKGVNYPTANFKINNPFIDRYKTPEQYSGEGFFGNEEYGRLKQSYAELQGDIRSSSGRTLSKAELENRMTVKVKTPNYTSKVRENFDIRLTPELKTGSRLSTAAIIGTSIGSASKIKTFESSSIKPMSITSPQFKVLNIPTFKVTPIIKTRQVQRVDQVPKVTTVQVPKQVTKIVPRIRQPGGVPTPFIDIPKVDTPPFVPFFGLPSGSIGGYGSGSGRSRKNQGRYTPTIEALVYGIKAKKKPKKGGSYTGLEVRGYIANKGSNGSLFSFNKNIDKLTRGVKPYAYA